MNILVGSKNPVKTEAVKEAFSHYFDNVKVKGISVDSKVPNQPVNNETFEGARNRALELIVINQEKKLGADFFVGMEGGIINQYSRWLAFGGIYIIDKKGREGFGSSPHFEIPDEIANELLTGVEMGVVMDRIMNEKNTKHRGGAIGFLTKDVIGRKELYVPGVISALVPFVNEDMYFK